VLSPTATGLALWLAAVTTAPQPPPSQAPPAHQPAPSQPPPAHQPAPPNRFRLALAYSYVLHEDGSLGDDALTTEALGLHWTFSSSSYVRNHFEIGEQWESAGAYSARGFRIDLISFGYPIRLVEGELSFAIEPIITPVRGEIMFPNAGSAFLRMEGGVGLEFTLATRAWYVGVEPLHVDFRYWVYTSAASRTGFSQRFPLRVAIGREF
jgi:hypothetical protein